MITKIMTWQTFKRRFNPAICGFQTSIFGCWNTISPTLQSLGFNETTFEIDCRENPRRSVDIWSRSQTEEYEAIVYYKWRSRDGATDFLSIYYLLSERARLAMPQPLHLACSCGSAREIGASLAADAERRRFYTDQFIAEHDGCVKLPVF